MDAGGVVCCTGPFNFGALDRKLDFDRMHAIFVSNSEPFGSSTVSLDPPLLALSWGWLGKPTLPYLTNTQVGTRGGNE